MKTISIIFVERLLFDNNVKDSLERTFKRSGIKVSYYDGYMVRFEKTNVYSIIGKKGIVIEDIDWNKGTGQIKVGGETWSAKTNEQIDIPKDSEVEVVDIDGVKAFVKPLKIASTK